MSFWSGLAESRLLGREARVALDRQRQDVAARQLSAVPGIASTTADRCAHRSGQDRLAGVETATAALVGRVVGLLPALTARGNVLLPVQPYRTSYDDRERARQLLNDVGLGGREDAFPSQLSGGQRPGVAIAPGPHVTIMLATNEETVAARCDRIVHIADSRLVV